MKVAPLAKLQLIGLQWAKLARSILCLGSCLTFHESFIRMTRTRNDEQVQSNTMGYKNGLVIFIILVGTYLPYISLLYCCLLGVFDMCM